MEFYFLIIWITAFLVYVLYIAFISWFSTSNLLKKWNRTKTKNEGYLPFIPKSIFNLIYFNNNQSVSLWFMRIMSILVIGFVVFCLHMVIAHMR